MAKTRFPFFIPADPDERIQGSVKFASQISMTNVKTFNQPESGSEASEERGEYKAIRSISQYSPGNDIWKEMSRKRGVYDDGEE